MQPRLTRFVIPAASVEIHGIIAWSKEDAPTDEQIKEVLTTLNNMPSQDWSNRSTTFLLSTY
jgi:hypothetical protein